MSTQLAEDEELALEMGWQALLSRPVALSRNLNTGAMLRTAFVAGWDARRAYVPAPIEPEPAEPDPVEPDPVEPDPVEPEVAP